jgi:sulfatase modifying factor 1
MDWYDAVWFCNKLSQMLGKRPYYSISEVIVDSKDVQVNPNANGFRLPTEKEWEYAAKAGTNNKYAGCDNDDDLDIYGWYEKNSNYTTHVVKTLLPNEWGFYDMSGNVNEWCGDKYDPKREDYSASRVIRGGSWDYSASGLRSAYRDFISADHRNYSIGFRVSASLVN